ncbi:MAG: VWA domain-containing protein [Bryobacteraceae bacterium]|jgi:VWFA-related protein
MKPKAAVFLICCGCLSLALAQSNAKSDSTQRLIKLSVAATNEKGDPVANLTGADIQLREDGKPRGVVFFRFAGSPRGIAPAAPGEFVNRPARQPILILLDRWNERMMAMANAWQNISTALAHMESVEGVYIYLLTARGDLLPVHSLPEPDADLRLPNAPPPAQLVASLNDAIRTTQGFRDVDAMDPAIRANTTFQTLDMLSSRMAAIAGRKDLIWVSHGFPFTYRLLSGQLGDFSVPIRDLSNTAAQSQVVIYTVQQSVEGAADDPINEGRQTLQRFSSLTGGRLTASGTSEAAVASAVADARGSYRLAYYSPLRESGGKEHKIRLDSVRKGVRLLTRECHFGAEPDPDPDRMADDAFSRQNHCPFDASEILLRVTASRRPERANLHLDIRVDPADILVERHGESFQANLTIGFSFYRNGVFGRAQPSVHKDLNFTQEQWNGVQKDGIVIPQDVTAGDELQQVRVMVFDRRLLALGSVTVPAK